MRNEITLGKLLTSLLAAPLAVSCDAGGGDAGGGDAAGGNTGLADSGGSSGGSPDAAPGPGDDSGSGSDVFVDVPTAHAQLLEHRSGFFLSSDGTGGEGGAVVAVTSTDDSGPGTIREAMTQPGPAIVVFSNSLKGQEHRIDVTEPIEVASDKTLWGIHEDGTPADVFIDPDPDIGAAFKVTGDAENVIFSNFKGEAAGPNDSAPDLIQLYKGGDRVWVDHFTVIGDGSDDMDDFVDVSTAGARVTISWSRIEDWSGASLHRFGAEVTLHHNLWRGNRDRQPKANGVGTTSHAYSNWIVNWQGDAQATVEGGQIRSEANLFEVGPRGGTTAISGEWGGSPAYPNMYLGGASADAPQDVFEPAYEYSPEPLETDADAQALRDLLSAKAGWRADAYW